MRIGSVQCCGSGDMGNVNDGFLEPLTIENLAARAFQKYAAGLAGFPLFPFSAQNDFLVSSSLISRACSSVSPIAGRPSSNLAGARACLSQTIQPVDPFLTR